MPKFPFEATHEELVRDIEPFIDAVFSSLESEFMIMPKGPGFIEYPVFERGYEALKSATRGFSNIGSSAVISAIESEPISIIVLRAMLGFSPPEWGYVTSHETGVSVNQGFIRGLDRKIRMSPHSPVKINGRIEAMVQTACALLAKGIPRVEPDQLHRLDKADTRGGIESLKNLSNLGVPYAMLLYERFLGRPFAGHRDSVSEIVGDRMESAIEDVLAAAGVSFRKTKRAERIEGFDQAPDFIVPSEYNPQIIIEAKITEDDGTARDKATRIQHLGELSLAGRTPDSPKYEVIACIGGRGFGVRRNDVKKMIVATRGKVFTLRTLGRLVDCTNLKNFKTI